jgi:hypothetical protein
LQALRILATKKPIVQTRQTMGTAGMGFFLSETDEDHCIVHSVFSAYLMGTQVFGFLTLKVKQRGGLLRGGALNFSNEFSGDLPQ